MFVQLCVFFTAWFTTVQVCRPHCPTSPEPIRRNIKQCAGFRWQQVRMLHPECYLGAKQKSPTPKIDGSLKGLPPSLMAMIPRNKALFFGILNDSPYLSCKSLHCKGTLRLPWNKPLGCWSRMSFSSSTWMFLQNKNKFGCSYWRQPVNFCCFFTGDDLKNNINNITTLHPFKNKKLKLWTCLTTWKLVKVLPTYRFFRMMLS